jgi:hypothetical protein
VTDAEGENQDYQEEKREHSGGGGLTTRKESMHITRIMLVGIVLVVLGITAFAYQGLAMQAVTEGQASWALPPIVGTAMLLAAGVVLVVAEAKKFLVKLGR